MNSQNGKEAAENEDEFNVLLLQHCNLNTLLLGSSEITKSNKTDVLCHLLYKSKIDFVVAFRKDNNNYPRSRFDV